MSDLIKRLCRPGYDLQKEQAIQEAIIEIRELLARIEAMERQEPTGWQRLYKDGSSTEDIVDSPNVFIYQRPLYALPGAQEQPAPSVPSEEDESVRKAWSRFSNELHRGPDAPYPGMSEAFEQHFSQSFTDRDWRAESGTWAAAWKAAKRHGAQAQPALSAPEGWKLVPTAESRHPGIYKMLSALHAVDNTPGASEWGSYAAMLAAAPEANP